MKKLICFILLINILLINCGVFANTYWGEDIYLYDKYEKINRKIFNINLKMNKIVVRNVHIIWESIFPNFLIDCLNRVYTNLEYPKRLISCILQRDKQAAIHETKRFIINTTFGLGGIIDSAYKIFKLEFYDEDIEQALSKYKIKQGNYLVLPFVSSVTMRDIIGRLFDFILTPSTYISSPIAAAVKLGLLINRTTNIQPLIKMVESNFIDPYDIAKKAYLTDKLIKQKNYDRNNVISKIKLEDEEVELVDKTEKLDVKGKLKNENLIVNEKNQELSADIFLNDYNPKSPIYDSMRTAFFDIQNISNTFWSDFSLWNRNFNRKIKTASVEIVKNRPKYNFKYILQKDKKAPLAIVIPSIGEGVESMRNSNIAKLFFDEGYSVLILGSHFQWEFLKSISDEYHPGLIGNDVKYINILINNAISYLSRKYDRVFLKRIVFATSLGAYSILFLGNEQMQNNANNIDKFIAICPPIELSYAIDKIDDVLNSVNKNKTHDSVAIIGAKLMKAYKNSAELIKNIDSLPFTNYEAKLISAYIFHQKLSDILFNIELAKNPNIDKKELYNLIDNTNYNGYKEKYLSFSYDKNDFNNLTSLRSISNYLISKDNYKIFHSIDDYLVNKTQLKELKSYAGDKLVLFSNGSHLGFLYRDEFLDALKKEIRIDKN